MEGRFGEPAAVHLIWVVLAVAGLLAHGAWKRRKRLAAFASQPMLLSLLPDMALARRGWKAGALLGALALASLTLMRPQWGVIYTEVKTQGIDILVLLDVSRSMLAEDIAPNRLERSKADIRDLVSRLEGDRVGLVAFAGKPVLKCPLTTDYSFFHLILDEITTDSAPVGGSMIGDAIRLGIESYDNVLKKHKAMILITDGEDQESFVKEAAERAGDRNIRIFTIGYGDPEEGQRIPVVDDRGARRFVVHKGEEIWSRMNPDLMREVALITGGAYVPASTASIELDKIYTERIATIEEREIASHKRKRFRERYQLFLAGAIGLLLLHSFIGGKRRRSARVPPGRGAVPGGAAKEGTRGPRGRPAGDGKEKSKPIRAAHGAILLAAFVLPGDDPMEQGNRLYRAEDFAGADALYQEAEVAHPESPEIAYNRAGTFYWRGDYERAVELYRQALRTDRRDVEYGAKFNLGNCRFRMARNKTRDLSSVERIQEGIDLYRAAMTYWRDAIEVDPEPTDPGHNLEVTQLILKDLLDQLKKKQEEQEKQKGPADKLKEIIEKQKEAMGISSRILGEPSRAGAEESPDGERDAEGRKEGENGPAPLTGDQRKEAVEEDRQVQDETLQMTESFLQEMGQALSAPADPDVQGAEEGRAALEEAARETRLSVPEQEDVLADLDQDDVEDARPAQGRSLAHLEKALDALRQGQPQPSPGDDGQQDQDQQDPEKDPESQEKDGGEQKQEQARKLTREEAERLLNEIRERDRDRKRKAAARARAGRLRVDRDW